MKNSTNFIIRLILLGLFGFSAGVGISAITSSARSLPLFLSMVCVSLFIAFIMYLLWRRSARGSTGPVSSSDLNANQNENEADGSESPEPDGNLTEENLSHDVQMQSSDAPDEIPMVVPASVAGAGQSESDGSSADQSVVPEKIHSEIHTTEPDSGPDVVPEHFPSEESLPDQADAQVPAEDFSNVSEYVVIDFETTGIDLRNLEVIQIGALKIKDGVVVDQFSSYVKPLYGLTAGAQKINHITLDDVKDAPLLRDVLPDLLRFIGSDLLVGYNIARFDAKILKRDVQRELGLSLSNSLVDVMTMARSALPKDPDYKLVTICEHLGVPVVNAHDATADCRMTYQCFEILTRQRNIKYNAICISDLTVPAPAAHQKEEEATEKSRFEKIKTACDSFSIQGKSFCLSGTFQMGSKEEISSLIVSHGGVILNGVSRKIDYLIVGSRESLKWKYGNYGTKVVKACDMIDQGYQIEIVEESVLSDYLRGLDTEEYQPV